MKRRTLNSKEKKLVILSFSIFWLISLALFSFIFFVILPFSTIRWSDRIYTNAKILAIHKNQNLSRDGYNYDVIVSYNVNDVEYVGELGTYVPTYHFIKNVKIYYDKNFPNRIGTTDAIYFSFGLIGTILTFNYIIYKKIDKKDMKESFLSY